MSAQLDPELAAILAVIPKLPNGGMIDLSDIPAYRAMTAAMMAAVPTPEPDPTVTVTVHTAARPDGSVLDLIAYRPHPATESAPALLWFHAGAQVLGSGHDDAAYLADLATTIGAVVISVDYRLAPETTAPGAAEDGLLAFTWTRENADTLHIDRQRIGLAGASGGGAPAVAAALMIRDQGLPRPRLLALNYPMLDDRNTSTSSHQVIDIGVFDRRENLDAWAAVLGDRAGTDDVDVYSAPGRGTDVHDLPPTFIAAAQYDVFRDEDIAFASALAAADVPVELHLYPGAFHAWDRFAPTSRLARDFNRTWHDYLTRTLATTETSPRA